MSYSTFDAIFFRRFTNNFTDKEILDLVKDNHENIPVISVVSSNDNISPEEIRKLGYFAYVKDGFTKVDLCMIISAIGGLSKQEVICQHQTVYESQLSHYDPYAYQDSFPISNYSHMGDSRANSEVHLNHSFACDPLYDFNLDLNLHHDNYELQEHDLSGHDSANQQLVQALFSIDDRPIQLVPHSNTIISSELNILADKKQRKRKVKRIT
jgi:hypothetical protein